MRCPSADRASRDRLLEAEPGELAGAGDTPLARHVATCARCRAFAGRILEAHAELDAALGRFSPLYEEELDRILARAAGTGNHAPSAGTPRRGAEGGAPARPGPAAGDPAGGRPRITPGDRRPWRWAAPALAAAAAAVLWLVFQDPPRPGPGGSTPPAPAAPAAGPDPVVADGGTAAVFATSNPEITVVWILEGDS